MSKRLRDHLMRCLWHDARMKAVETALERGILAVAADGRATPGDKGDRKRIRRSSVDENHEWLHGPVGCDQTTAHRIVPGPLIAGRAHREAIRVLARHGILDSSRSSEVGTSAALRGDDVWSAARRHAPPPRADEVAVMLLLVAAIEVVGFATADVRRVLRRPDWIIPIVSPVDGFAPRLVQMLKEGAFGRLFGVYDGDHMRIDMTALPPRYQELPSLIVFDGKDEDHLASSAGEDKVGSAARLGHPILGVAGDLSELPLRLKQAACLTLSTGSLTSTIVCAVLQEVLGGLPDDAAAQLSDATCALLSLHDLAVAIRPGREAEETIASLRRLAGKDENAGSRAADDRAPAPGRFEAFEGEKGRDGRMISTGSEISQPAVDGSAPTVETLHGYGAARQWALDMKADLPLWRSGSLSWSQMNSKLLLSGPPGTGKTSFARALCNTLQVPLVATSVSTWLEPSHLGDVIKRMRTSFAEARHYAPCVFFVDEVDGIGKRGTGHDYDDYWNAVVNKLLELLDGASKTEGVIIVGATNHPDVIDPAIRRSGRLETHIEIPLPDIDALVGILTHHLGNDYPTVVATRPQRPVGACGKAVPSSSQPSSQNTPKDTEVVANVHL